MTEMPAGWSDEGLARFATTWARALNRTRHVPMTRTERYELLYTLTRRLAEALVAPDADVTVGYRVGADLVAAKFSVPEALGQTITVLNSRLLADLGLSGAGPRARLTMLVEAVATGFARAAHDHTLDGQEQIRRSALDARNQAERALRASEARFRHAALHDALTGLPNRAGFGEWLTMVFHHRAGPFRPSIVDEAGDGPTGRVGVCCIGLDRFQAVNDSHGHHVGNELLREVARRLRVLAIDAGHVLARLDGDEFALLIRDTTCAEDAAKVADRALAALAEPFRVDGLELPISASAGVVEQAVAETDATEIMRAANIALHWAKNDGRSCWRLYEQQRSAWDVARYKLTAEMPGALQRGEFILEYQPLVCLISGMLAGVEALARWRHPVLGQLGAGDFIGLAENTGLIVPLGERLLELACHQAARWSGQTTRPPYVSVNLAVRQIRQPGLAAMVAQVLDRVGLRPELLQLEITESAFLGTDAETLATLRALSDLGVGLVLDDFGTGYANLAGLPLLPLRGIKLAGSFVQALCARQASTSDARFLAAVVDLGRALGLTVTAEGIESAAQAHRLRAVGCDLGQGYHFGRPVPAAAIDGRLVG